MAENNNDTRNRGRLVVSRKVKFTAKDDIGHVDIASFFIKDTANGHRKNLNGYDDTEDKIYSTVTDSSGVTPEINIILGIINIAGTNNRGSLNVSPYDWDLRGDVNTPGVDEFEYHGWSYNHLHIEGHMKLAGNDTLTVHEKLLPDVMITEKSQSIVDAYSIIETPYEAYDVAKSYITNIHHDKAHAPDHHDILLSRKGNTIITNNHDLHINKNASIPFDYDSNTDKLTIKSNEFVGDIDCGTGTLHLENGATVKGNITDATRYSVTFEALEPFYLMIIKSDDSKTYFTAAKVTNSQTIRIPKNTTIRYVAKAERKKFIVKTATITESTNIKIHFESEPHVSTIDISPYASLVTLASDGDIVFGKIDLRSLREESKTLFDFTMTSAEGLSRYYNYIRLVQKSNDVYFYEILHDRINLDTTIPGITFIRKAGLTSVDKSYFGIVVFEKNRKTRYTPNTSNNGKVEIDNLTHATTITPSDLSDIAIAVTNKVNASNIATDVNDIKNETRIIKTETDKLPSIKTETDKVPTLAKEKTIHDRTLPKADYFDSSTDVVRIPSSTKTRDYLYITDYNNNTIRKANLQTQEVTTIAGIAGTAGHADGPKGISTFENPQSIITSNQNLYITDWNNHLLRLITLHDGNTSTIAGIANVRGTTDGAYGTNRLSVPNALCQSHDGQYIYFTSYVSHTIRRYEISTGIVTTILGTAGVPGSTDGLNPTFNELAGIIITKDDKYLIVCDSSNYAVRKINIATKTAQTICGKIGSVDTTTEGTLGVNRLDSPISLALSADETYLYIAEISTSVILQVNLSTTVMTVIAGKIGIHGHADGIKGTSELKYPEALTLSTDGTYLIIADTENNIIRKLDLETKNLTTLFGTAGSTGSTDGLQAKFNHPSGVTMVSYHDSTRHTEAEIAKAVWNHLLDNIKDNSILKLIKNNLDKKISDLHDFDYNINPVDVKWVSGTEIRSLGQLKNTESEIATGTKKGLIDLSPQEKAKYKASSVAVDLSATNQKIDDVKTQTDKIPSIKTETDKIKNLAKISDITSDKNTEAELVDATKKGLTDLDQVEKDKYKANSVSIDLSSVETKLDSIKTNTDKIDNIITSIIPKATTAEINAVKTLIQSITNYDDTALVTKIDEIKIVLAIVSSDIEIIKKLKQNNYKIEQISNLEKIFTIFDDNGSTIYKKYAIKTDSQNNLIQTRELIS